MPKVFTYQATICCGSCGYGMHQVGEIDPETRDAAVRCAYYDCARRDVILRLPATVLELEPVAEEVTA